MSDKIRLLQITHDLAIGGLQQVVATLCRTIDREKFDVQVLCLRDLGPLAREIEKHGIRVHLLPQKQNGTDYFSFLKVADFLKKENIQVIHSHNTQPLVDGTLGSILAKGSRRIIHTDHARTFPDKRRYMFAEWLMSHFVIKMVGVSEHTTNNLHKYEKIPFNKLMTIPNGIDGKRYSISIDQAKKREELGLAHTGPVIGIISRLDKVKGITYLLQAMPEVIQQFPEISLIIAGDGDEKEALQKEAHNLGITPNVYFLGARMDVPELFQLIDIYLLPSLSEGLPMGLLESMAAGCPVIASNVGGIPKAIQDKESGILVSPGKPSELSHAITELLRDKSLYQTLSTNMQNLFNRHYSAEIMTKKYCDLYLDTHN